VPAGLAARAKDSEQCQKNGAGGAEVFRDCTPRG
jgi:hypothetical protein